MLLGRLRKVLEDLDNLYDLDSAGVEIYDSDIRIYKQDKIVIRIKKLRRQQNELTDELIEINYHLIEDKVLKDKTPEIPTPGSLKQFETDDSELPPF